MATPSDLGWGDPRSLTTANMVSGQPWTGHTVRLRNLDVLDVMRELVRRLRLAGWPGPDVILDEWGYARRLKRWAEAAGQTLATAPLSSWSDHAWGTALDLDTTVNPMLATKPANPQAHTTMPVGACPYIASVLGLEWGGGWTQPWDPQHWQVAVSPARLAVIAAGIRSTSSTGGLSVSEYTDLKKQLDDIYRLLSVGDASDVALGGKVETHPNNLEQIRKDTSAMQAQLKATSESVAEIRTTVAEIKAVLATPSAPA